MDDINGTAEYEHLAHEVFAANDSQGKGWLNTADIKCAWLQLFGWKLSKKQVSLMWK